MAISYSVKIPRSGHLPVTGPLDWIRKYDAPGIGFVFRRRLVWAAKALPTRLDRVLEVGYGSGIFQYELATRTRCSVGLDIHPHGAEVRRKLEGDGVRPALLQGDGATLPFRNGSFDAVVILSALEFIPDPAACLSECRRVLRSGGCLVCVMPRELRWADRVFRLLTRSDPESEFRGGRARVLAAVQQLHGATRQRRPMGLPAFLAPYEVLRFDSGS